MPDLARVHTESADAAYSDVAAPDPTRLDRRRDAWQAVIQDPQLTPLIAESDGEIVGVANVGPAREEAGIGELFTIYVLPSWWGTEVGQRLLERAQHELSETYREAVLTVLAANRRARRFYERNGWSLDGLHVEPHFGGQPTEVARYRRHFDKPSE